MKIVTVVFYIIALFYFYFGLYSFSLNVKSRVNRIFMAICISNAVITITGLFVLNSKDIEASYLMNTISTAVSNLIPGLILHFALELFLSQKGKKYRFKISLIYLPAIVFNVLLWLYGYNSIQSIVFTTNNIVITYNTNSLIIWCYFLYNIIFSLAGILCIYLWKEKAKYVKDKKTARILLYTFNMSFWFTAISTLFFHTKITYATLSALFSILWIFGVWYSIIRLNLMTITSETAADEILQRVNDLVVLVDPDGIILKTNQQFCVQLGYSQKELIGETVQTFIEERIKFKTEILVGEKNLNYFYDNLHFIGKNGEKIPVRTSLSAIVDKIGDLIGTVIVSSDRRPYKRLEEEITERKKTEEELLESNEKLKQLDQLKTDFISVVSHELRTPLTSILGFAKIMKKKISNVKRNENQIDVDELRDFLIQNLGIVILEAERLSNLINNILDISKLEDGKVDFKMNTFPVKDIIERAIQSTSSLLEEKKLTIQKELENESLMIHADFDKILQVLINLLSNAIKFSFEGVIKVKAYQKGQDVCFHVQDWGTGIDPKNHESIFEKFKQVGDTLTDRPQGTGLGLPISKQIIEYHGGRVWVESNLNEGTTVIFTIPLISLEMTI